MPAYLMQFADELARVSETRETANVLRGYQVKFKGQWSSERKLSARDIPIPVPRNQGLHPTGCRPVQAFLSFGFQLDDDEAGFPDAAFFQVRVESLFEIPAGTVEIQDHWRIDTDTFAKPKAVSAVSAKSAKEPHPYYHFQRGGHAQDEFAAQPYFVPGTDLPSNQSWKALGQGPSPRIAVLPMCPILAIDFAIGEHNGVIWGQLRNTPEYSNVIRAAQDRLWNPFFAAIANPKGRRFWLGPLLLS